MNYFCRFVISLMFTGGLFATEAVNIEQLNMQEIVSRFVDNRVCDSEMSDDYTFQKRYTRQELDRRGNVTKMGSKTYESSVILGARYEKLIEQDDELLSVEGQAKEEKKLASFFDKRRKLSNKERVEECNQDFFDGIGGVLPLLNLELVSDEMMDGYPVWVLRLTPTSVNLG